MERYAAAAVHAYTAVGAVLGLLMVHLAYTGDVEAVLWLFLVAMVIDGTDGFLARRLRVKEVMPEFDGALLDNIVDFLTYAFAPMVLLWSTGYLPDGAWGGVVAAIPVLASCYQFCRSDAKGPAHGPEGAEEDHYFLGFPSYWNIAAFYVIVVDLGQGATIALLLVLTVLVFVPVRCVYPSRTLTLWWLNNILAALWLAAWAVITALLPDPPIAVVVASLVYVGYYTGLSLWLTAQATRATRADRAASSRSTSSAPV